MAGDTRLSRFMDFPETELNNGSAQYAIPIATSNDNNTVKVDSVRNCMTSFFRSVPNTLRMPTSRALPAERAVVRFMKLMQAISNINKATAEKMATYCMLPDGLNSSPACLSEYKWILVTGI